MSARELVCEYKYLGKDGHLWTCVGAEGAVHVKIWPTSLSGRDRFIGGLEVHSRTPFSYSNQSAPDNANCWLLKAPCWHDGTSLYVSEVVIPFWQQDPDNHERMYNFLRRDYATRFEPAKEAGE